MSTGKQRRALRAQAHHLQPVVQIGKDGLSAGLIKAIDQALGDHELIKVKLLQSAPLDRHEAGAELAKRLGAELVQVLGQHLLLWRERPEEPTPEKPSAPPKRKPRPTRGAGEGGKPASAKARPSPRRRKP